MASYRSFWNSMRYFSSNNSQICLSSLVLTAHSRPYVRTRRCQFPASDRSAKLMTTKSSTVKGNMTTSLTPPMSFRSGRQSGNITGYDVLKKHRQDKFAYTCQHALGSDQRKFYTHREQHKPPSVAAIMHDTTRCSQTENAIYLSKKHTYSDVNEDKYATCSTDSLTLSRSEILNNNHSSTPTATIVTSDPDATRKQEIKIQSRKPNHPANQRTAEANCCVPVNSEDPQRSPVKEQLPMMIFDIVNKPRQRAPEQISRDYFGSSLQSPLNNYTKKTKPEEHEPTLDTDYEDFHFLMAPTIRFTPAGRNLQVYYNELLERRLDMRSELARYGSFDISSQSPSQSRSAMPWLSRLAQTGVWISHLAQAGFYRPEGIEGKLRCAFCNLDVDSAQLEGTRPMAVHRQLSPNCRFVTGQLATESQPREALGQDYLQN
ncbi:hypothetical protein BaRGS_00019794 [Batillaria attramentaria]|uniref:Uncharacterized protein n=1 Tax=Batillaria attramentaria TaxID=370345 RepID=A0ABD0KPM2_9CAEN